MKDLLLKVLSTSVMALVLLIVSIKILIEDMINLPNVIREKKEKFNRGERVWIIGHISVQKYSEEDEAL